MLVTKPGGPKTCAKKGRKKKPFLTYLATAFEPVSVTGNPERERVNVPVTKKKNSTVRGAAADTAGQRAKGGKGFFRFLPFGGRHRWGRCPSAWGPPSFSWAWRPRPALHRPTSSTSRPDLASSPIFACGEDGKTASLLCETPEYEEETFRRVYFPL